MACFFKNYKFLLTAFLLLFAVCAESQTTGTTESVTDHFKQSTYTNPVFEPILADPSVLYVSDSGYFYAYGTEDDWGDGEKGRLIPIIRSVDLVNWSYVGNAFSSKPNWKNEGGLWAPDIYYSKGKYLLYYSFSTWGDPDPGIGVAVSDRPEGPFLDQGKLFTSKEIEVPNSIDPFYFEEDEKKYLFWGSFSHASTQGTYGIELSSDGLSILDPSKKFKIAAGDFEAVMIHKKGDYYYFFGSKGSCCEGEKSQYRLMIARSLTLTGPYLDKNGQNIAERGNGTLLLEGNDAIAGPGHNARLVKDDEGNDWILYHAIDKKMAKVSSGASRRALYLDPVIWKDGWPEITGRSPGIEQQPAPIFNFKNNNP